MERSAEETASRRGSAGWPTTIGTCVLLLFALLPGTLGTSLHASGPMSLSTNGEPSFTFHRLPFVESYPQPPMRTSAPFSAPDCSDGESPQDCVTKTRETAQRQTLKKTGLPFSVWNTFLWCLSSSPLPLSHARLSLSLNLNSAGGHQAAAILLPLHHTHSDEVAGVLLTTLVFFHKC